MKNVLSAFLSLPAAFLLSSVAANAGPRIIIGAGVNSFIGGIQLTDKFDENAKIIEIQGYTANWSDAIGGEGSIVNDDSSIRIVKIFAVPFSDASGIHRSSIIGGILQPKDGIHVHEFITIADIAKGSIVAGAGISPIEQDAGIKPLIHAIQTGSRSDIWSIILSGTIPGKSIQAAFEASGVACTIAPTWFPDKGIWYASTCIRNTK